MKSRPIDMDAARAVQRIAPLLADPALPKPDAQMTGATERPPAPKWIETAGGRVDLIKPIIKLQGSYWSDQTGDMQSLLKPEKAYIAHGILVVEELGLWFPLSAIHHGKKSAP